MKIICLSCGHKVDLGDAYDDYAGQIKCSTCGAILELKTEAGGLKAVAVTRWPRFVGCLSVNLTLTPACTLKPPYSTSSTSTSTWRWGECPSVFVKR